jgi:hypothetical protein
MTIQFWSNEPTVLFNKDFIFELWPTNDMCYEQKLNAITRLIILITILGYILTMTTRILVIGFLTLAVIFVLFKMRKQKLTKDMMKEGFFVEENNQPGVFKQKSKTIINPVTLDSVLNDEFKEGNKRNPFSNVLLTQINDDPERKSAPPAFNVDVDEDITKNVKRSVQMMNPGIKNTNKQLYPDLWQNFLLDDSNRVFYSTANTRVEPGDQSSFGKYLYGTMFSAKESTPEGNMQRIADNYRYTLY